jgi:hypothetical protein
LCMPPGTLAYDLLPCRGRKKLNDDQGQSDDSKSEKTLLNDAVTR